MKAKPPANMAASVRQRLLNIAQDRNDDFQRILTQYALERLLYRISKPPNDTQFILKGALLFLLWLDEPHRRTKDLDLLSAGEPSPERLARVFRDLCELTVENDGLVFDANTVSARLIREESKYGGVRIRMIALLEQARIPLQIDVGFGDVVSPAPLDIAFPTLLDFPVPHLRAYPKETMIAEKLSAVVSLDMENTRMKDFYDLWTLGQNFAYDGEHLRLAVSATFMRGSIEVPVGAPTGLSTEFANDFQKQAQWEGFVQRSGVAANKPISLPQVIEAVGAFLLPVLLAVREGIELNVKWAPGGPWGNE